jgi:transcription elongation factor GreB
MASSPYITADGMFRMNQELSERWQRRRHVVQALAAAAAEGDRSENAEYIYRKKELREIDRRIPDLMVIDRIPDNQDAVFFAAYVTLLKDDTEEVQYRIVGPDEIDHAKGNISVDSPLARALLKKQVHDEVSIQVQDGGHRYLILDINY